MLGRPKEHRVKMTIHVLPLTEKRIRFLVDKDKRSSNTQGKVVDQFVAVRIEKP